MSAQIVARGTKTLGDVTNFIHDCWFERDDILFSSDPALVTIPFSKARFESESLLSKSLVVYYRCFLRILHARSLTIEDQEEVGSYDFDKIVFKPSQHLILITSGIPIKIKVLVEALEVVVETTDEILAKREERRLVSDLFSRPPRPQS